MSVDRMGDIRRSHRDKQRARWPEDAWAEVTRLRVSLDQASQIMDDLRQQHRGAVEALSTLQRALGDALSLEPARLARAQDVLDMFASASAGEE